MSDVSSGWIIGWVIGLGVTALVVVLLILMIRGASRAADKAESIVAAFHDARENTAGLWNVNSTNKTVTRITDAAGSARQYLEAKAGRT